MNWKLSRKAHNLTVRSEIIACIRSFFSSRGYLEVDTPFLIPSPAPESCIDAIKVGSLYLHTSPELCMKRMLAAGYEHIFQICHCWRAGERGKRHLPEFTMLEWYRSHADYRDLMVECAELLEYLAHSVIGRGAVFYNGYTVDLTGECRKISVRQAFEQYAGTTMETALAAGNFDRIMIELIEPNLGLETPTILYGYPAERAALAKLNPDDHGVAERFELYVAGLELANAFSELTDESVQRQRFIEESKLRSARGAAVYPLPEPFLAELGSMPKSAGIALGLDRLVMILTGTESIDDVVAFTPEDL